MPSPYLTLGEWQHGSAPVFVNGVEVGRVSMFSSDRYQFHGSLITGFSLSALGDTWIEACASWFCKAVVLLALK